MIAARKLAGALGAEVSGVDLSRPLSKEQFGEIKRLWLEHLVIFFRDQALSEKQYLSFATQFGEPVEYPLVKGIAGYPKIIEVKKLEHERTAFGAVWHSDTAYLERPPMASMLLAREIPPYGGDTLFANMYSAFESLSSGFQELLSSLKAVNSSTKADASKTREDRIKTDGASKAEFTAEHPVVRTHPETGRKALYVNPGHTVRFAGWTEEESAPLLKFLYDVQTKPELTCRFSWQPGSIALWDNRCAQHNPVNDYHGHRRVMLRITLAGGMFRLNLLLLHAGGRMLLSVLAIALGVALGYAVHLVNRAAVNELSAGVRALSGEADLEVRGGRSGFPEILYAQLARLPGVAVASPVLEADAAVAGGKHTLLTIRLIGIDPLRAALLQPALFADDPAKRLELLKPDVVLVSPSVNTKETLQIISGLQTIEFHVAGTAPLRGNAALTDIATAQWRLGRLGELNRIDLRLAPGADREAMREKIAALLPPGAQVATLDAVEESGANLSRAYRVNLNVLALVALFTGGFLVFSAQALEVARRRREHALLRVLGLARRGLARLVLAEAALLGALGGLLGIAGGYALAAAAVRVAGADLGAGMFRGMTPELSFSAGGALAYLLAGIAIALLGAALPALDAARTAPAQALKAGDEQAMFARTVKLWPGLLCIGIALLLLPFKPLSGIPVAGYLSIASLLVGGILLMPWVSQFVFENIKSSKNIPYTLALAQLRGAPGQAMVSLAAIVASFSLMAAMAIMVASFRSSVDDWLGAVLPADLYFRTSLAGETAWIDAEMEARVRVLPQVERVVFLRSGRILLDPARPPVALLARDAGAVLFPSIGMTYERKAGDPPAAWISEAVSDLYGFSPGSEIKIPINNKDITFVVAGVWRDYARQHGAIVIERELYAAVSGDRRANDAALWLKPGADAAALAAELRALPGGGLLDIAGAGEIRQASLAIFDRSFAVTYALEAVAVLVGLFGLASSVGAIVLARRREFGMLRHLGMTRSQVGAMLAAEGGLLALLGVAVGLALGGAISLVLIHVVNRQSFNWSMDVHMPYGLLLGLSLLLILLSSLTAFLSGREATGMGPVLAVKEDW